MEALVVHRLQFALTVGFHYIFPQITMGLALLIVILKTMALRGVGRSHRRALLVDSRNVDGVWLLRFCVFANARKISY